MCWVSHMMDLTLFLHEDWRTCFPKGKAGITRRLWRFYSFLLTEGALIYKDACILSAIRAKAFFTKELMRAAVDFFLNKKYTTA